MLLLILQMKGGSIDYIPFQKALVLQGHEADEELKEELAQLEQIVNDRFNNVGLRFDALEVIPFLNKILLTCMPLVQIPPLK